MEELSPILNLPAMEGSVSENQTQDFEQPDVDHLRKVITRDPIWRKAGRGIAAALTHPATFSVIVAVLIIGVLAVAGFFVFGN